MASAAFKASGSLFKRGDGGSPEVFSTVAEVKEVSISPSSEFVDVTSLDSTGGYREHLPSFRDGGDVPVSMNRVTSDAGQSGLITDYGAGTLRNFKIVFSDTLATTVSFAAYVQEFEMSAKVGDVVPFSVTLKISGAPVWS